MTLGIRHKLEASWGPLSSNTLMSKPIFWTYTLWKVMSQCECTHEPFKLYHTASYGSMPYNDVSHLIVSYWNGRDLTIKSTCCQTNMHDICMMHVWCAPFPKRSVLCSKDFKRLVSSKQVSALCLFSHRAPQPKATEAKNLVLGTSRSRCRRAANSTNIFRPQRRLRQPDLTWRDDFRRRHKKKVAWIDPWLTGTNTSGAFPCQSKWKKQGQPTRHNLSTSVNQDTVRRLPTHEQSPVQLVGIFAQHSGSCA